MHIEADRALIPANTHAVRHLTITITAPAGRPRERRAPVSVALVLDRSGSMDGPKIEMARHAVAHAIKLLSDQDQLALVVYDDEIDTLLERAGASKEAKNHALNRLAEVSARGATDLSGGWFRGSDELGGTQNEIKRVLLLTDGLANRGVVDHDELARAAADLRGRGITTTAFGVGADFDEELLTRLATQGGGHFYFIARPKQIPDFFASELGEMLDIVAREAVLDITCGPGVEVRVLSGQATESSDGRVRVRLGDLVSTQEITVGLAVTCAARVLEDEAFIDCRVTDRDGALNQTPMRVEWHAASTAENERQPVNDRVLVAVSELLAERARFIAMAANRRGTYDEAVRVVRDVIEHLRALAPDNAEVKRIIAALQRDVNRFAQAMSPMLRKQSHFASYNVAFSRSPGGKARRSKGPRT